MSSSPPLLDSASSLSSSSSTTARLERQRSHPQLTSFTTISRIDEGGVSEEATTLATFSQAVHIEHTRARVQAGQDSSTNAPLVASHSAPPQDHYPSMGNLSPAAADVIGDVQRTRQHQQTPLNVSSLQVTQLESVQLEDGSDMEETAVQEQDKSKKFFGSSCHSCKSARDPSLLMFCTSAAEKGVRKRKCRKKYCLSCLRRSYHTSALFPADGKNWVCPSCCGLCVCAACARGNTDTSRAGIISGLETLASLPPPVLQLLGVDLDRLTQLHALISSTNLSAIGSFDPAHVALLSGLINTVSKLPLSQHVVPTYPVQPSPVLVLPSNNVLVSSTSAAAPVAQAQFSVSPMGQNKMARRGSVLPTTVKAETALSTNRQVLFDQVKKSTDLNAVYDNPDVNARARHLAALASSAPHLAVQSLGSTQTLVPQIWTAAGPMFANSTNAAIMDTSSTPQLFQHGSDPFLNKNELVDSNNIPIHSYMSSLWRPEHPVFPRTAPLVYTSLVPQQLQQQQPSMHDQQKKSKSVPAGKRYVVLNSQVQKDTLPGTDKMDDPFNQASFLPSNRGMKRPHSSNDPSICSPLPSARDTTTHEPGLNASYTDNEFAFATANSQVMYERNASLHRMAQTFSQGQGNDANNMNMSSNSNHGMWDLYNQNRRLMNTFTSSPVGSVSSTPLARDQASESWMHDKSEASSNSGRWTRVHQTPCSPSSTNDDYAHSTDDASFFNQSYQQE